MTANGRRELFRGDPLRTASVWVVIQRFDGQRRAYWQPHTGTVAGTRAAAIQKYDRFWEGIPDAYRKARRRGEVLAVHCIVEPVTFEGGGS